MVPNILTIARLVLVPVFVFLLIEPSQLMVKWALGIFIFASITDYLDGWVARKFNSVTDAGKLLDPLADKILVMSALVMLVGLRSDVNATPWAPAWMVVVILAREIWVTGLRAVAAASGRVMAAQAGGKWKSALQMIGIIALLMHYPMRIGPILVNFQAVGIMCLAVSIVFSILSAIDYTRAALKA
jgi:CDP-diacylglycerol--glycerol-3-phosphate 3-phosphatidyltransferase